MSNKRYILKVKSSTKIPDFVQIRDKEFRLLGYLRLDRPMDDIRRYGINDGEDFKIFLRNLPFGRVAEYISYGEGG